MLSLDTSTYLLTQDNAAGPIVQLAEDGFEAQGPIVGGDDNLSRASWAAYLTAYALLAGFVGCLLLAL